MWEKRLEKILLHPSFTKKMDLPLEFVRHLAVANGICKDENDFFPVLNVMWQYQHTSYYQVLMKIYNNNELELAKIFREWFKEGASEALTANVEYKTFYYRPCVTIDFKSQVETSSRNVLPNTKLDGTPVLGSSFNYTSANGEVIGQVIRPPRFNSNRSTNKITNLCSYPPDTLTKSTYQLTNFGPYSSTDFGAHCSADTAANCSTDTATDSSTHISSNIKESNNFGAGLE
jgi:hypothetical protein